MSAGITGFVVFLCSDEINCGATCPEHDGPEAEAPEEELRPHRTVSPKRKLAPLSRKSLRVFPMLSF